MNRIFFLSFLLLPFLVYGQASFTKENLIVTKADSLFEAGDYNQSAKLYRYADSTFHGNTSSLSYNIKLAECYLQTGKLEDSEKVAGLVLKNSTDTNKTEKTEALLIIGRVYFSKGNTDDAKEYFTKAFELVTNEKNSLIKSKCYDQLGIYHWLKGNQEKALEFLQLSLDMRKELMSSTNIVLAYSYNNLGLVWSGMDAEKALENYKKALLIYQASYSMQHPKIGITLNNIAITQRQLNQTEESIATFKKALDIWTRIVGDNHSMTAFIYSNIGESYSQNKQYELAFDYLNKGLTIYKSLYGEKHPEVAATYNSLGNVYLHQKKYYDACDNFQSALCANTVAFNSTNIYTNPSIGHYYNPDLLLVSLLLKSKALNVLHHEKTLKIKDLQYALSCLFSCDSLISKLRHSRTSTKDKIELGKQSALVYEEAIFISMELSQITFKKKNYEELAFYFAEKNKGAVLQEAIADASAKSFAGIPDSLLAKEKQLKQSITLLEQQLAGEINREEESLYRKQLFELNNEYEHHIHLLERVYPDYYNLKFNSEIVTIPQLQISLAKNETIVSYFVSEDKNRIIVFSITQKSFRVNNNPLPENFMKEIKLFRNSIKIKAEEVYLKSAYRLYSLLIPKLNSKTSNLIIIPDGKLGSLPFEAFITSPSPVTIDFQLHNYLLKKYAISYSYSSQLFYNSRLNKNEKGNSLKGILLCAPVSFDSNTGLNSLPGTAEEVEKITALFQQNKISAFSLLYENAREDKFKNVCSDYTFIHLASHGIVNENQPELSQLFLNPSPDKLEDGNLYSGEIYNLKINAELVVLSACQTGLGNIKKGEGIIGLSRALLYAGADNLIVSLWAVSDESTSKLMINFYSALLNLSNQQFTSSLRESKLRLINEGHFSHPYYWAPFILIGR